MSAIPKSVFRFLARGTDGHAPRTIWRTGTRSQQLILFRGRPIGKFIAALEIKRLAVPEDVLLG